VFICLDDSILIITGGNRSLTEH